MTKNTKGLLIILSIIMVCSLGSVVRADDTDYKVVAPDEVPDILSMLAAATEANYEKIHTWQGRITSKNTVTIRGERAARLLKHSTDADPNNLPGEIQMLSNRTAEFKIDVEDNRFFSLSDRTEPPAYLDSENNKVYPLRWGPGEQTFLVTSEHEIEITPGSWGEKDGVIKSRIAMKHRAGTTDLTDPRKVFYIGNKTLWLTLSQLSQTLQIPDIKKYNIIIKEKATSINTTYRVEIHRPDEGYPFQVLVLSGEAGLNRTYIENWYAADALMSRTTTEFVNIDGVFVPKRWEFSHYYRDGGLMRQESCTIEHQQINEPVPDSVFSEYSYLKDGDSFRDRIKGKDFECKNGKLVELSK